jgi:hypothetical protein
MQRDDPGSDAEVEIDQRADPAIRAEPDWTMDDSTTEFTLRSGKERVGLGYRSAWNWRIWRST